MKFNFHNRERLWRQINELANQRVKDIITLDSFECFTDDGTVGRTSPQPDAERFQLKQGEDWVGLDTMLFLKKQVTLPQSFENQDVIGVFDLGTTGGGNNSLFESLLFVNGKPYQALDTNHKEVFFDVKQLGLTFELTIRLWSGLVDGYPKNKIEHRYKMAQLGILDFYADKFYFLTKNIMEAHEILEESSPYKEWLMNILVSAFNRVDYSTPMSAEFFQSIQGAYEYLKEKLQNPEKMDVEVSLVGHTHIDVAWLWRYVHTREKVARSFSTVNRLMERYPDYKFVQSQAQLYDFVKQDYPEIYANIQQRVAEKKWEPGGSMWVECDCNLVSLESLIRQILYGKLFFRNEFGVENDYLWLPDVFGYSWALPQVLKKAGIHTFVTTKISWNDTNKMPYDTFVWRGIDGSEVTIHFITTPEHSANRYYTYNGIIDPFTVKGVWDYYSNKDINKELLVAYGYGDGGGGVNRDMLENWEALDQIPGLPKTKSEFPSEYFKTLNETLAENKMEGFIPVWDGELYLEFHRGTYTSQAFVKKENRRMEFFLKDVELFATHAAVMTGYAYPKETFMEAWKTLLRNQFHDVIPGSSIHEVYEDVRIEYQKANAQLRQIFQEAIQCFVQDEEHCYTVLNTTLETRSSLVHVPASGEKSFVDGKGNPLQSVKRADNGYDVWIDGLQPMGMETIVAKDKQVEIPQDHRAIENHGFESKHYRICWNDHGHLTSVYCKEAQRELVPQNQAMNVIQVFEDKPRQFDAWELESTFENKMEICDQLESVQLICANDLYADLQFSWRFRNSTIQQVLRLYEHSKRIDFITNIDWQEREKLVKVLFPLDIHANFARFDIQNGSIQRSTSRNTNWDAAKYEVVGHKWCDLSESGFGVAVLNDCKYGYDVKDHFIRLTLLKSSNYPDIEADKGAHSFVYALLPHQEVWYESGIEQEALDLNNPLYLVEGQLKNVETEAFFTVDGMVLNFDALKPSEIDDGYVLRLHEKFGRRGTVTIDLKGQWKQWCPCDLMENNLAPLSTEALEVQVKPYEIISIKLK